ncbi:MAG: hypothetical protein OSB10_05830, partial [Planctomycetota bacterium]|nr:hypothetical protein [Planctomycetota bacterium]
GFGPTWLNTPDHWQTIQYPDVDDDGRADVCGTIQFADVNDDGADDICAQSLVAYRKPPSNRAPDLA